MIGTMVLVLMGCGSAVFAGSMAGTVGAGVGTVGVALAFGLSVVAMAYAIGGISGCHINPAITLGVFLSGRMNGKDAGMYMLFQVIGAIIGSAIGIHRRSGLYFHFCIGGAGVYRSEERGGSFRRPCHRSFSGIGAYRMYPYYRYFRQSGT